MIARWNATVRPQDIVYHLGDVGFTHDAVALLRGCQGRIRVILGNHDPFDMRAFTDAGVEKVFGVRRLFDCWLTHIPMHDTSLNGPRVLGNIHGHIHDRPSPPGPYFNACVEQINYTPIDFEEVRARIQKKVEDEKAARRIQTPGVLRLPQEVPTAPPLDALG
jgi:calcineurin-like phosphoesterase family protein